MVINGVFDIIVLVLILAILASVLIHAGDNDNDDNFLTPA